jgi:two-component system response regulator AlgR
MSTQLRVLIADDEALARARLHTLLADCSAPGARVVAEAVNATQAVEFLLRQTADVALIDIHMPGADGLSLARTLRTLAHPPAVVFVTAHAEHAVQAFELEAVDYLTKPVRLERLQAALQKVERLMQSVRSIAPDLPENSLVIIDRGQTLRVPIFKILFIRAELKYLTVRTAERNYVLEDTLNELEAKYPAQWLRIHRNTLVARRAVQSLEKYRDPLEGEGWAVRLDGVQELLLVSRRQLPAVRALVAG